jgi:hypothetical protein
MAPTRVRRTGAAMKMQNMNTSFERFLNTPGRIKACITIAVAHRLFDRVILVTILLNSIFLALDNPQDPSYESFVVYLRISEVVFTVIFGVEMVMKMIAMGLFRKKVGYVEERRRARDRARDREQGRERLTTC